MAVVTDIRRCGPALRRRAVILDGEPWRELPAALLRLLELEVGDEVDTAGLTARVDEEEPGLARERAMRLITARERSVLELTDRLIQDGFSAAVARSTVEDFTRAALVDDERFAYALARTLANARGAGRSRIARDLAGAGIDEHLASAALDEALDPDEELAAARRLAAAAASKTGATVDRVASRLVRRGYRTGVALSVAREALEAAQHSTRETVPDIDPIDD